MYPKSQVWLGTKYVPGGGLSVLSFSISVNAEQKKYIDLFYIAILLTAGSVARLILLDLINARSPWTLKTYNEEKIFYIMKLRKRFCPRGCKCMKKESTETL